RWDANAGALVEDPAFPSVPQTYPPPASLTLDLTQWWEKEIAAQAPYFADIDGDGLPDLLRSEFGVDTNYQIVNSHLKLSRNASGTFSALQPTGSTLISIFPEKLARRGGRVIDRFGEYRAGLHVTDGRQVQGAKAITLYQDDSGQLTFQL